MQPVENILDQMTEQIVRQFKPLKIILFGSHARRAAHPGSDVDLLVVLATNPDSRQSAIAIRRALSGYAVAKDIIVTTPEEITRRGHLVGTVLRSALREGTTLYERS